MSQIFGINPYAGSNNRRQNYQQPNDFSAPVARQPQRTVVGSPSVDPSYLPPGYSAPSPQYADQMARVNARNNWNATAQRNRESVSPAGRAAAENAPSTYLLTGSGRNMAEIPVGNNRSATPGFNPNYGGQIPIGISAPRLSAADRPQPPKGYVVHDPPTWEKNPNYQEAKPGGWLGGGSPAVGDPKVLTPGGSHVEWGQGYAPPAPAAPATQPSAPQFAPPTQDVNGYQRASSGAPLEDRAAIARQNNQQFDQAHPGSSPGQIQFTEQQARETWRNSLAQFGGNLEAAGQDFHQKMQHYGVDGHALLNQWSDAGTLHQNEQMHPATTAPGANIPLSMLGPDNGLDRYPTPAPMGPDARTAQSSSPFLMPQQRQATPGPSIQQQGQVTPAYTTPFQGSTPLNEAPGPVQPAEMPGRTMASRMAMGSMLNYGGQSAQPASKGKQTAYASKSAETSSAGGHAQIKSDAEYNALPSGATFVGPDGIPRRKP